MAAAWIGTDKVDGVYYLLIGEAGTFHDHAVTIARSDSVR